jgi:hypothetical protein
MIKRIMFCLLIAGLLVTMPGLVACGGEKETTTPPTISTPTTTPPTTTPPTTTPPTTAPPTTTPPTTTPPTTTPPTTTPPTTAPPTTTPPTTTPPTTTPPTTTPPTTPPTDTPVIIKTTPYDLELNVNVFPFISVLFSKPMDREATENAVIVSPEIDYEIHWDLDDTLLVIENTYELEPVGGYSITIKGEAMSKDGFYMGEDYTFTFKTAGC